MNRREFLSLFSNSDPTDRPAARPRSTARAPLSTGLEPFVADAAHPWDTYRAAHLLRRTVMMPTNDEIAALVAAGSPGAAVDILLERPATPAKPAVAASVTESLEGLDIVSQGIVRSKWQTDAATLRQWWAGLLRAATLSMTEKMTLFWSSHFTTKFVEEQAYVIAPLLYRQNAMFRDHALGNFADLTLGVSLDGAMLVYLGGNLNTKGKPNENYARELMELFTTGLGAYTEADIQQAARILTGWRVAQFSDQPAPNGIFATYFDPAAHDTDGKIYLGASFAPRDASTNTEFLVRKEEIEKMIDTLFAERADAIAHFVCRKIYRYFVYSDPSDSDESVISAMAALFIQSNFEIKPVMSALLKSAHFFDNLNIGAQIKTPAEYVVGIARQLTAASGNASATIDSAMTSMDQQLFEPPNVAGWPGYRDWVTTNTYPVRTSVAANIVAGLADDAVITFIKSFAQYSDGDALVGGVARLLLPRPTAQARHDSFAQKLTAGAPIYEWGNIVTTSPSTAARNMRDLLTLIVSLPDFELC
jgi:uncharacterized protein (DUF1800 family)